MYIILCLEGVARGQGLKIFCIQDPRNVQEYNNLREST